jgi:hypothetical protein
MGLGTGPGNIHKFKWVWARVRVLHYPALQPTYTNLYNMINNLFTFGVQLINLFSYLSLNLSLKTA